MCGYPSHAGKTASGVFHILRFASLKSPLEVHGPSTSTSESTHQLQQNTTGSSTVTSLDQGEGTLMQVTGGKFPGGKSGRINWEGRGASIGNGAQTDHGNGAAVGE